MNKIILIIFFYIIIYNNAIGSITEKIDCSKLNKLSKEYAKCLTLVAKEKGKKVKEKVATDENKNKLTNIKTKLSEKLKKFKNSKTGKEFIEKN